MGADKDQLLAMGFDAERVDWAFKATKNGGLQEMMDHALAHSAEPIPAPEARAAADSKAKADDDDEDEEAQISIGASSLETEAKSIKCSTCHKIFRNSEMATFHANKSGHQSFEESTEEIKPLTEGEKVEKLAELRAKLQEKRAKQEKDDAKSNKANENLRRLAGKDAGQMKEDLRLKEAEKEAAQRKRDKIEDAKARAAIKAQIEADKKARAEKQAREKAIRDGTAIPGYAAPGDAVTHASPAKPTTSGVKGKDYKETRLQVRLEGSAPLTKSFSSDSSLMDVAEWVASESLSYDVSTIRFLQAFPRKQFSAEEMHKSLRDNGLTPSAVLIAS